MVDSFTEKKSAQSHLVERVKELTCLYDIARIAADTSMSIEKMLTGIVGILPNAWQYPIAASAKIVLDNRAYSTGNYPRSIRRQRSAIIIDGKRRGYVEVAYSRNKMIKVQKPFLNEEQKLLDTVAREIAHIILRREAEMDKLKLEEQLRHADRLATIGQLTASVVHELNEPLGHILGFAELLQKCPNLPAQAMADADKIFSTSLHAREIVKQLLIFSRHTSPRKAKVNLNQLIKNGLNFLECRCISSGIKLNCCLCPDLPDINADASQLNQVFVSLMVNAMQAMPQGGTISISTQKERAKAFLIIEDTGIGMDEEILQKIFTPFFTTKEVGMGTGLGLPVVRGIITAHDGSIKVESKVGRGTKCKIQLPVGKRQTC